MKYSVTQKFTNPEHGKFQIVAICRGEYCLLDLESKTKECEWLTEEEFEKKGLVVYEETRKS